MENEGEQAEGKTEQQIEQQEIEAGQQDSANANGGRSNSDEEEPIKADPNAADEQSKWPRPLSSYPSRYDLALLFATTPSISFMNKEHKLIISLQSIQLQMQRPDNLRL